jgi:hypothetical protein
MFQLVPTMFLQWWKPCSPRCCLKPKVLVKTQAQALQPVPPGTHPDATSYQPKVQTQRTPQEVEEQSISFMFLFSMCLKKHIKASMCTGDICLITTSRQEALVVLKEVLSKGMLNLCGLCGLNVTMLSTHVRGLLSYMQTCVGSFV